VEVVRVHETGPPEVLRIEESAEPVPGPGQVLVAVGTAAVGYGDVILRSGRHPFPRPYVPGLGVGGTVAAAGPGVDPALTSRRVVASTAGMCGGYAQFALAEAADVHAIPAGLGEREAVAVFQAGAVAVGLLDVMAPAPGESVLVTAAAGRIGSLLVRWAKATGAGPVVAASGGADKARAAARFGADLAVDYSAADWVARVRRATGGRGADVVLDAVGGAVGAAALEATADGGRFGLYGFTSGTWTPLDAHTIGRRGLSVVGPLGVVFARSAARQHADAELALRAAADGRLLPHIHGVLPLRRAAQAHAALESRSTVGAVLLTP
jgi:NADPH2:quinone reductase